MTRIKHRANPVWHETEIVEPQSRRVICVAETPAGQLLKLKGTRQVVVLPWGLAFTKGAELAGDAARVKPRRRHSVKRGVI